MKIADVRAKAFAMPLNNPAYPAGSVPVLQSRIPDHHLPHRSRAAARAGARAARGDRRHGELRIHPHARFHRLRRLHRNRPGDPGALQGQGRHGPGRRLRARHVSRRRSADRRRPRDLGLPEEARDSELRTRTTRWSARCTTARCSASPPPWATSTASSITTPIAKSLAQPNFMLKIIPHVDGTPRICELVRYYCEDVTLKGAWAGPGRAAAASTTRCAPWPPAGARGRVRHALRRRPDARPRRGRPRLSGQSSLKGTSMARFDRTRSAIITGAASGIGKEIALRFAAEGAQRR